MAQAPTEGPLTGQPESSTAASILRNDDPLTLALRGGADLDMDEIAHLNRAMSPGHDAHSSLGTSSTAVFSTHDESTVTKPTSTGTLYPRHPYKGKGKAKAPYASSLSVAHGSGSEADAQHQTARRDDLLAMGDWASSDLNPAGTLKGSGRAKKRCQHGRCTASKKPSVKIVQPKDPVKVLPYEDHDAIITVPRSDAGPEQKYLRRRATHPNEDQIRRAEEGQIHTTPTPHSSSMSLSSTRMHLLFGVSLLMILTISLSAFGAYHTGKTRMACTKGIVFGATVLMAFFTVLMMIIVRRAPQEALLAGLMEMIIGFALLAELNDFM